MNNLPLVTVAIPCYNHAHFVQEAIQSVIDQDYENIELIIIDDGSKDNSVDVIQKMVPECKQRFKHFIFIHRPNVGLSATLNEMLSLASGAYFSGCASDDILLPTKISKLVASLEAMEPSYVAAFGDALFINDTKESIYFDHKGRVNTEGIGTNSFLEHYTSKRGLDFKNSNEFGTYRSLLAGNYLPAMSNVIRLEKIKEVGAWTSGNTIEDWELWLSLSKKYSFLYVDMPVALYRLHNSNTIKTMKFELIRDSIFLLEKEKKFATDNGHKKIFKRSFSKLIRKLKKHDKRLYIRKFLENNLFTFF